MRLAAVGLALSGAVLVVVSGGSAAAKAQAQAGAGPVRLVQVLEEDATGVSAPVGIAFSPQSESFYVLGRRDSGTPATETDVAKLRPFDLAPGSNRPVLTRVGAALQDPINVAFDPHGNRLLLLGHAQQLLEVRAGSRGDLDRSSVNRANAALPDLRNPQGMTVDPSTGTVYILDAGSSSIVRLEPGAGGRLEAAPGSAIDLSATGLGRVRGVAFDPSTGNLHLGSGKTLVELTTAGGVVSTRDLSGFELANPEGMVVASSGDLTDASTEQSVYLADSGATGTGQVVELSLAQPAAVASIDFTSQLVRTVNMGALSPPSPDPSGITHVSATDRLVVVDGEVEETVNGISHFQGANVWELNRNGLTLSRTTNISTRSPTQVPLSNEPVGVAFNPSNGHYYVSDDNAKRVYDLNPGSDGLIGTSNDTWTSFSTQGAGNTDPEGLAYKASTGRIYVADGVNREVYEYTTSGTLLSHFDTARYGVDDPESVEVNSTSGTLYVLSNRQSGSIIIETTTSGSLIQTIGFAASGARKPAGLAYANASNGSGVKRFFIVDRGVDNNSDPRAVDGKLYEMTTPGAGPPGNNPPQVSAGPDQTITLPAGATLDGTVTDDGLPNPPGSVTTTWTKQSGPGTVTFGNANAVDTTATFSQAGTYVLRLTASDSALSAFDELTVTVNPPGGGGQVLDRRVSANPDDAEEVAGSGVVQRGDGDLDMMTDSGDTKLVVGTRFTGVAIPRGATITNAYLQFTADEVHSVTTSLTIRGQAADNPTIFTTTAFDLSSRPTTAASASWSPGAWLAVGDAGLAQRSSNLAAIIQELVNRAGWASGNSVVLLVTGSGRRVAVAHNQNPAAAALLHVEWTS
jgi:uncharacterized protein YjiK